MSARRSDPRQHGSGWVELLGERLRSGDGLERIVHPAPLHEEPHLVDEAEQFDGRPFPLDRTQRLLEQALGLVEFEAFEVHRGDDAERLTDRIVLSGPAFIGECQCSSPESICGVQVAGIALDGAVCTRHDDRCHRRKTLSGAVGSETPDPVEVVEVVPDPRFGNGQVPCDLLGRVEQLSSSDGVRHRPLGPAP